MEDFEFSENLREQVEEAIVKRITLAFKTDDDLCESVIRHGQPNMNDMPCNELMDNYMNWHGAYSLEECPDDKILRKMIEEYDSYIFEKEVLNKEKV